MDVMRKLCCKLPRLRLECWNSFWEMPVFWMPLCRLVWLLTIAPFFHPIFRLETDMALQKIKRHKIRHSKKFAHFSKKNFVHKVWNSCENVSFSIFVFPFFLESKSQTWIFADQNIFPDLLDHLNFRAKNHSNIGNSRFARINIRLLRRNFTHYEWKYFRLWKLL